MKNSLPYTKTSDAIIGYTDSLIAKSERADCVVRAVASATGMDYNKAHKWVETKFNRKHRKGTFGFAAGMNGMSASGTTLNRKSIKPLTKVELTNGKSKMTVGSFAKIYNKGAFVITVSHHAFTIKNGVVIGNTDDSTKIRRIIKCAWKIGS